MQQYTSTRGSLLHKVYFCRRVKKINRRKKSKEKQQNKKLKDKLIKKSYLPRLRVRVTVIVKIIAKIKNYKKIKKLEKNENK